MANNVANRIPKQVTLVSPLEYRNSGEFSRDQALVNGYVESSHDSLVIYKRPGYQEFADLNLNVGKGIYSWRDILLAGGDFGLRTTLDSFIIPTAWEFFSQAPSGAAPAGRRVAGQGFCQLFDGRIIIIAGSQAGPINKTARTAIYDPKTDTWTQVTDFPGGAVDIVGAAALNADKVLVLGEGSPGNAWIYNVTTDNWSTTTDIPVSMGVSDHDRQAMVVGLNFTGQACVVAPLSSFAVTDDVYMFSLSNEEWSNVGQLSANRLRHACAALLDNRILVCGGRISALGDRIVTTEIFNPFTGNTALVADLPEALDMHAAVTLLNGNVFVTSGTDISASNVNSYVYNVLNNTWSAVTDIPGGALVGAAMALGSDGRVYLTQGSSTNSFMRSSTSGDIFTQPVPGCRLLFEETDNALIVQNGSTLTLIDTDLIAQVLNDPDLPVDLVPGVVFVSGYLCVMTRNADIFTSNLNFPTQWEALDFVNSSIEPDRGVALSKSRNHVIALNEWSTEFFYVTDNPTNSPLQVTQQAVTQGGCAGECSVWSDSSRVFLAAQSRSKGKYVARISDFELEVISTPVIDRILEAEGPGLADAIGWGFTYNGHLFYILDLASGITLVWDDTSQLWYRWETNSSRFAPISHTVHKGKHYVQTKSDGVVHEMSDKIFWDDGALIEVSGRTRSTNLEVYWNKVGSRLRLSADKIKASDLSSRRSAVANLVNPGAEAGDTSGWTNTTGTLTTRSATPDPHAGSSYFQGSTAAEDTEAYQDITTTSIGISDASIDLGTATCTLSWAQANNADNDDPGYMELEFYNGSDTLISAQAATTTAYPDQLWHERVMEDVPIPANTRKIRVIMFAEHVTGAANNAYFDSISLTTNYFLTASDLDTNFQIRWSSDDFDTFMTSYRNIDLKQRSPGLTRLGVFDQIGFEWKYTVDTAFRCRGLEIDFIYGQYGGTK